MTNLGFGEVLVVLVDLLHQLDGVGDSLCGARVQRTRLRVLVEMGVGGGHVVASEEKGSRMRIVIL